MEKLIQFSSDELISRLSECAANGITELSVHDASLFSDKGKLLAFLSAVKRDAPELFVSVLVDPKVLDSQVCKAFMEVRSSIEIPMRAESSRSAAGALFFDKKFYSKRCAMLNNASLVFGLSLFYADLGGDSLKSFKDRLDFAVAQYPNHIEFQQTENADLAATAHVSQTFSAEDIRSARNIAFACRTFYSAGRAVPWFNSILCGLRITPCAFFSDFAEWQQVNNCDFKSGFVPEEVSHNELERMQLLFLEQKFEEKKKSHLIAAVNDIVSLNGALSRLVADGTESVLETDYNPEDIFSPEASDVAVFVNDVCMEHCTVKVFLNDYGEPDFKIL